MDVGKYPSGCHTCYSCNGVAKFSSFGGVLIPKLALSLSRSHKAHPWL